MNNSVVIKGNKNGIVLVLDPQAEFQKIKDGLIEKFAAGSKFFEKGNMAITFEGRDISSVEERELLDIISEKSELNIVCIIDNDEIRQENFRKAVDSVVSAESVTAAKINNAAYDTPVLQQDIIVRNDIFYKGTLRSGQVLESEGSAVVLGDVNPGGKVVANGNIVILGCLKGNAFAGASGDSDAFVMALEMDPMQIQIAEVIARCSDGTKKSKNKAQEPKIAYVEDGNIYIEKFEKEVLSDIRL